MIAKSDDADPGGPGRARVPRRVVLLGWVSFFADVSGEMVYPLIPLFVVGVLGASATTLGGIEGGAQLIVAIVTAWAGWRSDRVRRRVPYVRIGYGLPVIGKAILAAATAWPLVLGGRLVDRLGKGLRGSPRDALIADSTEPAIRGRAFGLHRAMDTAGAMVGTLLAAAILWWLTGSPEGDGTPDRGTDAEWPYRLVFWTAAALGLVSLAITFLVREAERPAQEVTWRSGKSSQSDDPTPRRLPARYWRTITPLLVFGLANSSDAFLLLRARELGMSPWAVVLAYACFNVTYTVVSYPAGVLSDRLGRWRVIALGWVVYGAVYAGFAFTGAAGVWPLLAIYGVYTALTDGVGKALITDVAPREMKGTALGVYFMLAGFTTLLASVLAGAIWDRFGAPVMFGVAAVMALGAAGVVVATEEESRQPTLNSSAGLTHRSHED